MSGGNEDTLLEIRNNDFQREQKISRHEAVTFRANKHTRLIAKAKLSDESTGQHVDPRGK